MNKKTDLKQLTEIFITFFKIGCFTFGGGYAMIPFIEKEVITNKNWIEAADIVDVFAVSQSLPGAIAINSSTSIGYKIAGKKGAVSATIGVVLPSFIIITMIAILFTKFQDNSIIHAAFLGIRSAVIGLILMAAIKIGKAAIKDTLTGLIAVFAVILILIADIHAIFIIIGGALLGMLIYWLFPNIAKKIVEKDGANR